jgi:hypothetical protein
MSFSKPSGYHAFADVEFADVEKAKRDQKRPGIWSVLTFDIIRFGG